MGPGGPAWPGGPFKPWSPWEKDIQTKTFNPPPFWSFSSTMSPFSHLPQVRGSLVILEDQSSHGVPGVLLALSSLWIPPNHEHPEHRWWTEWSSDGGTLCRHCYSKSCLLPWLLSDLPSLPSLASPNGPEGQNFKKFQPDSVRILSVSHTHKTPEKLNKVHLFSQLITQEIENEFSESSHEGNNTQTLRPGGPGGPGSPGAPGVPWGNIHIESYNYF